MRRFFADTICCHYCCHCCWLLPLTRARYRYMLSPPYYYATFSILLRRRFRYFRLRQRLLMLFTSEATQSLRFSLMLLFRRLFAAAIITLPDADTLRRLFRRCRHAIDAIAIAAMLALPLRLLMLAIVFAIFATAAAYAIDATPRYAVAAD